MLRKTVMVLKSLRTHWVFWLCCITGIAIILRSLPAWLNPAWGCDFGIYYGLTNSLVENMELFNEYTGWGGTYQYFPVLYAITGIAHWITGLDVLVIMPKIAPIFGGLSVLIFYFIVYELLHDRKIALIASVFLAVMPFHVYQTSHASPLTMGHFFFMLSLFFFIKYRNDTRFILPLMASTMLLIMSHHLTTYFYLLSLVFIVFVENLSVKQWTTSIRKDIVYVLLASGFIFGYWITVATPVFSGFMNIGIRIAGSTLGSTFVLVGFYVLFGLLFGIIWLKRRLRFFYKKELPTNTVCIFRFVVTLTICLGAMIVFSLVKMPWTNFSFTPLSILYSVPLLVMISFGAAGFRYLRFLPNGGFLKGWMCGILVSFIYGLVTNSQILFPHRHFEYLMAPLSVIAFYGIKGVFGSVDTRVFQQWSMSLRRVSKPLFSQRTRMWMYQKRQLLIMIVVLGLVTTNAISVYPSHVSLNASYEVITDEDLAVVQWMADHLDKNHTIIASDHRLARMTESAGFRTTLDEATVLWSAINFSEYAFELLGIGRNYSAITHVFVDDVMKNRVVHVGFGDITYMNNASYEKFSSPLFNLVYRNETYMDNGSFEPIHWAEVYAVNGTMLYQYVLAQNRFQTVVKK